MRIQDDSDMKIVGEYVEPEDAADELTRLLKEQQENGNLDRARALGESLIDTARKAAADHPSENATLLLQRWLLLLFTTDLEIQRLLPNGLVARTAFGRFYDVLQQTEPAIYEQLQQNGSLSFYYLCQEDGVIQQDKAAETFASLCGRGDDKRTVALGKALIAQCKAKVDALTAAQGFVK